MCNSANTIARGDMNIKLNFSIKVSVYYFSRLFFYQEEQACIILLPRCFQRSLSRLFLLSPRQVMQGINGQQNREMLWCLQGRMMTQDKPLFCPKCCMCISLLAPEKNSKLLSSEKCLYNCYSKWKKSHHEFRTKIGISSFPLPQPSVRKVQACLGSRGSELLCFLAVAAIMIISPPPILSPGSPDGAGGTLQPLIHDRQQQVHYRNADRLYFFPLWKSFGLPELPSAFESKDCSWRVGVARVALQWWVGQGCLSPDISLAVQLSLYQHWL